MKMQKTSILAIVLVLALVATGFAVVLFQRRVPTSFYVTHANLRVFNDAECTDETQLWDIGPIQINDEVNVEAMKTVYIKNIGNADVEAYWKCDDNPPDVALECRLVATDTIIMPGDSLTYAVGEIREFTFKVTVYYTVIDGANGFNIDIVVQQ